jgi:hypothetical protein
MNGAGEKTFKGKDAALAWMDLTYHYADRFFRYFVEEKCVRDDDTAEALNLFLEIVTFVYCRVVMEVQRRISGQRLKELETVFSQVRSSWGAFFVDYPKGPRLEYVSAGALSDSISKQCALRELTYASDLKTFGALQAMRNSCAVLIRAINKTPISKPPEAIQTESLDVRESPMIRYVEELTYSLNRDTNVLLAGQTL